MLPKFDEVPISTYLIVLAKMRRPSTTPSARMPRSLSSRTTAAASLATSAAESTEIPTSAWWSAIASLTPSPRKATSEPRLRWARMMRNFCSGVTRAKMVVFGSSAMSAASSSCSSSCPVTTVPGSRPTSRQRHAATCPLSPVTILTVTSSRSEPIERVLDVGFERVGEAEESLEGEVVLVIPAEVVACERTARDRHDPRTRGEEAVEGRLRLGGHGRAAGEDGFRCPLGDHQPSSRRVGEDRGQLPLVVEGQTVERRRRGVAVDLLRGGPECAVELVASLVAASQAEETDVVVRHRPRCRAPA